MNIIQAIVSTYEVVGKQVENCFKDQIKLIYETNVNKTLDGFTVSFEILVLSKMNEDDYGLVFSTSAQHHSHLNANQKIDDGYFIITDLSFGNGKLINSSDEFIIQPSDKFETQKALSVIKEFVSKQIEVVNSNLVIRYNLINKST